VTLPLRAFLGVTFLYAGFSKLTDHHYLDGKSPLGVRQQMLHAAVGSPISGLVTFSAHQATVTGLLIAFGEIAAGLGVMIGLWTRLAATVGLLLALSFFLTVSWKTTPYYFGSDIVFVFAWTPLLIGGDGGLLSVQSVLRRRVRADLGLSPTPSAQEPLAVTDEVGRRVLLRSGALAGALGFVIAVTGGLLTRTRRGERSARATPHLTPSSTTSGGAGSQTSGQAIAKVSDLQVGDAKSFTGPDGNPAWLLHPSTATFTAFSAVCTHQGCPVQWAGGQFQCPCHGATYDANGQVTGGPAPSPLQSINVKVIDGQVVAT